MLDVVVEGLADGDAEAEAAAEAKACEWATPRYPATATPNAAVAIDPIILRVMFTYLPAPIERINIMRRVKLPCVNRDLNGARRRADSRRAPRRGGDQPDIPRGGPRCVRPFFNELNIVNRQMEANFLKEDGKPRPDARKNFSIKTRETFLRPRVPSATSMSRDFYERSVR